jgi:hypothetical protein
MVMLRCNVTVAERPITIDWCSIRMTQSDGRVVAHGTPLNRAEHLSWRVRRLLGWLLGRIAGRDCSRMIDVHRVDNGCAEVMCGGVVVA